MATGGYQTQTQAVLEHLLAGNSITSWEAIQRWHVTRLARVIGDLEALGYVVPREWESGNGKRWVRYYPPKAQMMLPAFNLAQQAAH